MGVSFDDTSLIGGVRIITVEVLTVYDALSVVRKGGLASTVCSSTSLN